jgi:hypothetical protein
MLRGWNGHRTGPDPPVPRGEAVPVSAPVRERTGFSPRTIGNAERGTHPPSLALRRALDQALKQASEAQRNRFLAALQQDCADQGSRAHDAWHVASLPLSNSHQLTAHLHDIEQRDETLVTSDGNSTFGWFGRGDLEAIREMASIDRRTRRTRPRLPQHRVILTPDTRLQPWEKRDSWQASRLRSSPSRR